MFAFRYQESVDSALLRTLIQAAAAIDSLPQESAVYRGLERLLSDQITREIYERRKRCVMSVLATQKRGLDAEVIAQVSRNCTEKAAAWALTLGVYNDGVASSLARPHYMLWSRNVAIATSCNAKLTEHIYLSLFL